MKTKEQFQHDLLENHELMTVIKFLNTYLDDTGKLQLGHCLSLTYQHGYADCLSDMQEGE